MKPARTVFCSRRSSAPPRWCVAKTVRAPSRTNCSAPRSPRWGDRPSETRFLLETWFLSLFLTHVLDKKIHRPPVAVEQVLAPREAVPLIRIDDVVVRLLEFL